MLKLKQSTLLKVGGEEVHDENFEVKKKNYWMEYEEPHILCKGLCILLMENWLV